MQNTALILIDFQKAFQNPAWGERNNPQAEENAQSLRAAAHAKGMPVYIVRHDSMETDSSLHPSHAGNALMDWAEPLANETLIVKNVNSALIGTMLDVYLRQAGTTQLIIAGLVTDHCVSTTTRMASNMGYQVLLASDATATFERTTSLGAHFTAEQMHAINLASLDGEFATVLTTSEIIAKL